MFSTTLSVPDKSSVLKSVHDFDGQMYAALSRIAGPTLRDVAALNDPFAFLSTKYRATDTDDEKDVDAPTADNTALLSSLSSAIETMLRYTRHFLFLCALVPELFYFPVQWSPEFKFDVHQR